MNNAELQREINSKLTGAGVQLDGRVEVLMVDESGDTYDIVSVDFDHLRGERGMIIFQVELHEDEDDEDEDDEGTVDSKYLT